MRVLSGREEATIGARRHLRFPSANGIAGDLAAAASNSWTSMASRSATASAAAGWPAACRTCRRPRRSQRQGSHARRSAAPTCCRPGEAGILLRRGGTWRNLARLHMNTINYRSTVMHHYEMGVEIKLGCRSWPGRQGRHRQDQGHRGDFEEPSVPAALWRRGATGDHFGHGAVQHRRLRARRARGLPVFRCSRRPTSASIR